MRHLRAVDAAYTVALALALHAAPAGLDAQAPRPSILRIDAGGAGRGAPPVQEAERDTTTPPPVSPGGAFLRSLAVPGWGHAAVGSYTRAGFYFTTSAATGWMLFKTARFLDAAETRRDLVEAEVREQLEREGVTAPDSVTARLEANPRLRSVQGLVEARSQQMEDWTAFGLFWLLLSGADAFVSAHLADFPEPVEVDLRSGGLQGPSELRISVPVGAP